MGKPAVWFRQVLTVSPALVLAVLTATAGSARSASHPSYPGITLIPAEEILSQHTLFGDDGSLCFTDLGGTRWNLVSSPSDEGLTNHGDGSFHPVDVQRVLDVLDSIPSCFLVRLEREIYLLPCPRRGFLNSSAAGRSIYLSPGVYSYAPEVAAGLIAHELGHAVHHAFLPDQNTAGWAEYAKIRGISDTTIFRASAAHACRPHEIFAEDFRVLFGGALAAGGGSIENSDLVPPDRVPGLREFLRTLAEGDQPQEEMRPIPGLTVASGSGWVVYPNPAKIGEPTFLRRLASGNGRDPAGDGSTLCITVYDAAGRLVRRIEGAPRLAGVAGATGAAGVAGVTGIALPSSDSSGRDLPAGSYWVRITSRGAQQTPVTVPVRRTR